MSALRTGITGIRSALGVRRNDAGFADRFVLPRAMRRPLRVVARVAAGDMDAPRHTFAVMSTAFLAATGIYGAILGGHMPAIVQSVASNTGFAITEVAISGNTETSEIDVVGALGLDGWTALPGFSPEQARSRIAGLPWVEQASVRKIYPATLQIKLDERKPFALWQQGDNVAVIDRDGSVIANYNNGKFANLPLVVGEGAAQRAELFMAGMARFPVIASRVKGYVRVSDRRWDLRLDNGVTVRLPERGELGAVQRLSALQDETGLLDRDVVAIDMRLDHQMAVQLSPDAAKERADRMEKIVKDEKKRGQRT